MVKETKFYDLLDVSPHASEADLKKAYRQKTLQTSPDGGGDPELFKEVTHAYEVLSDPDKRSVYDAKGAAGLSEPGTGAMDPQELSTQLFGERGLSREVRKTKDLFHHINVTLEDLYKGKISKLTLTRNVICSKCGGNSGGGKTRIKCRGHGVIIENHQMGPMIQHLRQACKECSGTGEIISEKDKCKTCSGRKVVSEKKVLEVHINKGMRGGQRITFYGESDQAPGFVPGDVIIVIDEHPHERFERQGTNLLIDQEIDLLTALGGGQFSIKHLGNRALIVDVSPGEVIKNGDVRVINDEGMPSQNHQSTGPGGLYITFKVIFPDHVDPEVISFLEKALPPRKPVEKFPRNILVEEVEMSKADSQQRQGKRTEDLDQTELEDDDEPRVQCAQQ